MHGLGRAFGSTGRKKRFVWSVLVLCSAGWALYQLIDVVQDFYQYPVTTVVKLKHESQMMFPAITICNINIMKSSMTPRWMKEAVNSYQKKLCTPDNFTNVDAGIYGKCHTFRSDDLNNMLILRSGPQKGLVLEMTIEHSEYTSLAAEAGVKVIVHDYGEVPFPEDGGILAQPGMTTSIALKKTMTHRLPPPYGECVRAEEASSSELNLFDQDYDTYTENACMKSCYQLSLYKECRCCDGDLPCDAKKIFKILGNKYKNNPFVPVCNTSSEEGKCVSDLEIKFLKGELHCSTQCPPACDQTTFDVIVSTALWPSDPYLEILMHHANRTVLKNKTFDSPDDLRKFIPKNFLKLEIFYEKLDFLEVLTKPMYDWSNLLGNIGGQLGLWLGFSVLTAVELLELCLDIGVVSVRRLQGKDIIKEHDISLV